MRIVCISDTHGMHDEIVVPDGDALIHAGDLTRRGTPREIRRCGEWLAAQRHPHKIVIAGNHDFLFESDPAEARALLDAPGVTYLEDSALEIDGVHFWGSPWQPWFHTWAFNLPRGEALRRVWARIPARTDVLVTHGPPFGVLDRIERTKEPVGCEALTERLRDLDARLHVFGHIHEAYGVHQSAGGRVSINASIATLRYEPTQAPIVVDWCMETRSVTLV